MMTTVQLRRPLVLASASPRRAELLAQLGLSHTVRPGHIDEPPPMPGEPLRAWARRAATDKARAAAALLPPDAVLVLGADTVVALPGADVPGPTLNGRPVQVMGKPRDVDDARRMLTALAGRTHLVLSAFALLAHPEGAVQSAAVVTRVTFRPVSARELEEYLATGEPLDKAGAYGIQGRGAVLVARISGDYYTVVGLPLARLWQTLAPWRAY